MSRTIYSLLQITRCWKNCSIISKQTFPLHPPRCMHHVKFNFKAHTVHNKYRWRMRLHRTECMLKINYYFPSLFMLKNSTTQTSNVWQECNSFAPKAVIRNIFAYLLFRASAGRERGKKCVFVLATAMFALGKCMKIMYHT